MFVQSCSEDLVPILDATGARMTLPRAVYGTSYRISFYRPRIEGLFARIERWVAADTGITHGAVCRATTSQPSAAMIRRAGSPIRPTRRRSSPGGFPGPGMTRATSSPIRTPPKTAPGSIRALAAEANRTAATRGV